VTDPASPASKAIVEYTWGKIWNAKAYNACSNMPRFGHMGMLSESRCGPDGAAAGPEVACQPVTFACEPGPRLRRAFFSRPQISLIAKS
jgi:hypothetical protein